MTPKNTLKLAVMAFAALTASTALAAPSPQGQLVMRQVSYADLDLRDAGDAQMLLHRIRGAAIRVCQITDKSADALQRFGACYGQAVAGGVDTVGAPLLDQALRDSRRTQLGGGVQASH